MSFHVLEHALATAYLTELRDAQTPTPRFRDLVRRVAMLVTAEALRSLPTQPKDVQTPLAICHGAELADPLLIVPILRAGLVFAEGISAIIPEASIGHIGLYRDEKTLLPVTYLCRLPENLAQYRIFLADPMLATGNSSSEAADILIRKGALAERMMLLTLVATPQGRDTFAKRHPGMSVWTAALDDGLNERAYILPGLGDAGDRLFGTVTR